MREERRVRIVDGEHKGNVAVVMHQLTAEWLSVLIKGEKFYAVVRTEHVQDATEDDWRTAR